MKRRAQSVTPLLSSYNHEEGNLNNEIIVSTENMNALDFVSGEASLGMLGRPSMVRKRQIKPSDLEGSPLPFILGESEPGCEHMAPAG